MTSQLPAGLDHLIYAAPDLDEGMDSIERLLGVRPMIGGRHPDLGTRNALVAIGGEAYLEVIAPDPGLPAPARGRLFDADTFPQPALATWVLRDESIEAVVSRARDRGVNLGEVAAGHRRKPDGTRVSWKVSDPYAMPLDGAVPFVIAWGDTPHPSLAAPSVGTLSGLEVEHPDPAAVETALGVLGVALPVACGERFRLKATIRTGAGDVEVS